MRSILSLSGQSVWDISIKHMGSVDPVFEILALNPGIRIDETIPAGTEVFIPETPTRQRVVDYYELNNLNPSTGIV